MACFAETVGWYSFLKQTKNSYHSKHVRDHIFTMFTRLHLWCSHLSRVRRIFLFLKIYYSILQVKGLGVTQLVIFWGCHKCLTPKWFKITTNSVIKVSSIFNIKPDTFWLPQWTYSFSLLSINQNFCHILFLFLQRLH